MPALVFKPGYVEIATPFSQLFIDELKATIPHQYRSWDKENRVWKVWQPYVSDACATTRHHFTGVHEVNPENYEGRAHEEPGDRARARAGRDAQDRRNSGQDGWPGGADDDSFWDQAQYGAPFGSGRFQQGNRYQQSSQRQTPRSEPANGPQGLSADHRLLGVLPGCDPAVLKAAYGALAKKLHPDRGGSDAQMRELTAAYERLRGAS